jgi:hypothetical protein
MVLLLLAGKNAEILVCFANFEILQFGWKESFSL